MTSFTKDCLTVIREFDDETRGSGRTHDALAALKDGDVFVVYKATTVAPLKRYMKEKGFAKIGIISFPNSEEVPPSVVINYVHERLRGKKFKSIVFDHLLEKNMINFQLKAFLKFQESLLKK